MPDALLSVLVFAVILLPFWGSPLLYYWIEYLDRNHGIDQAVKKTTDS